MKPISDLSTRTLRRLERAGLGKPYSTREKLQLQAADLAYQHMKKANELLLEEVARLKAELIRLKQQGLDVADSDGNPPGRHFGPD